MKHNLNHFHTSIWYYQLNHAYLAESLVIKPTSYKFHSLCTPHASAAAEDSIKTL